MTEETSDAPHVSVVIPARNAATTIDEQLASLAAQDCNAPFEVLVVDNQSTDGTAEAALAWRDRLPLLRVVHADERPGAAHARNVGIAAAVTDHILLCDADDVTDGAWVRVLANALQHSDVVCGGTVPFRDRIPEDPATPRAFGGAGYGFLPALISCSCGLRRSVWAATGGFDETLDTCEDIEFAWRIQLRGFTLAQEPAAFVYYREPLTPQGVFRRWFRYGRNQPELMRRFRSHGLRREDALHVLAGWGRLALTTYALLGSEARRRAWYREAGRRLGRVAGSVSARCVYL